MEKLRYSVAAKCTATILAVLFGLLTAACSMAAIFTDEIGLYDNPLEQVVSKHCRDLQKFYAAKIFCNINHPASMADSNMEYGIIKADSLKDVDLSDNSSYLYQNFKETDPEKHSVQMTFHTGQVECLSENPTVISSLVGRYRYEIDDTDQEGHQELIQKIVYNKDNGILYYVTKKHSFPIKNLMVDSSYASLSEKSIYFENPDGYLSFSLNAMTQKYESDDNFYKPLDTSDYKAWKEFSTDDGFFIFSTEQVLETKTKNMPPVFIPEVFWMDTEEPELSDLAGYPTIHYNSPIDFSGKTYHVISNVKENKEPTESDIFIEQEEALHFLYHSRMYFIAGAAAGGLFFLLLFGFCCYSAGCREKDRTVRLSKQHKIPLLFYLAGMGICIAGSSYCAFYQLWMLMVNNSPVLPVCILTGFFLSVSILLSVLCAMNLCCRWRGKVLARYTVCHYIASPVKRYYKLFCENTTLLWKGILIFAGISFVEMLLIFCTCREVLYDGEGIILLLIWFLIKMGETSFILFALLQMKQLQEQSRKLAGGSLKSKIDTSKLLWEFKKHGEFLNQISQGMSIALEERLKSEHFKTELITNVSHDIKTPLTSIINYVDLLQKEGALPETAKEYLEVLDRQSARLKKLIEDLIEASKASTGNLTIQLEPCDIGILLTQTVGEFEEKLSVNELKLITQEPDVSVSIQADSRHLWRIFDNLMTNICKYAQPKTRVYINLETDDMEVHIFFRNISRYALPVSGQDLTERFVRGDASRNAEGNGLGLSIAQSLAELMNGRLQIVTDGDLFKAILSFPLLH